LIENTNTGFILHNTKTGKGAAPFFRCSNDQSFNVEHFKSWTKWHNYLLNATSVYFSRVPFKMFTQ